MNYLISAVTFQTFFDIMSQKPCPSKERYLYLLLFFPLHYVISFSTYICLQLSKEIRSQTDYQIYRCVMEIIKNWILQMDMLMLLFIVHTLMIQYLMGNLRVFDIIHGRQSPGHGSPQFAYFGFY